MNICFRLNREGGYDRLLRLSDLQPGDIFKFRREDGTFILDASLKSEHFVCMKPVTEMTEDRRYIAHSLPLLICWACIQKLHMYFCEHFGVTDYAMIPTDLNNLCYSDEFDIEGWKTELFPKYVSEFTSEEKRAARNKWWKYAIPALKIDNGLYIKSKAS